MKVTFIQPAVGKKPQKSYAKTWCMEPLAIAVLAGLTPNKYQKVFYDDRIEGIPYDEATDIVAITTETYTAKRAYEIAKVYRERNIPVVMGGFHATLATNEVKQHADVVVVGEAEATWPQVLNDFENGALKSIYRNDTPPSTAGVLPNRAIFNNKRYLNIGLVESTRGCYHSCEFCSIYGFYKQNYRPRSIDDIVDDIKLSEKKFFFIVDDNVALDRERTIELCKALKPLKIGWFGQVSMHISKDFELLQAMKDSGCIGVLVGFESLNKSTLELMGKNVNLQFEDYNDVVKRFRCFGLIIYATFVFGYPHDTEEDFKRVLKFAKNNKVYMNSFNHLVPFPGTPMYDRFKNEGKLINESWWLADDYKFGDVVFHPGALTAKQLSHFCYSYRREFFKVRSILWRSLDFKANCSSFKKAMVYFVSNFSSRIDVEKRQGLPVGHNV